MHLLHEAWALEEEWVRFLQACLGLVDRAESDVMIICDKIVPSFQQSETKRSKSSIRVVLLTVHFAKRLFKRKIIPIFSGEEKLPL